MTSSRSSHCSMHACSARRHDAAGKPRRRRVAPVPNWRSSMPVVAREAMRRPGMPMNPVLRVVTGQQPEQQLSRTLFALDDQRHLILRGIDGHDSQWVPVGRLSSLQHRREHARFEVLLGGCCGNGNRWSSRSLSSERVMGSLVGLTRVAAAHLGTFAGHIKHLPTPHRDPRYGMEGAARTLTKGDWTSAHSPQRGEEFGWFPSGRDRRRAASGTYSMGRYSAARSRLDSLGWSPLPMRD